MSLYGQPPYSSGQQHGYQQSGVNLPYPATCPQGGAAPYPQPGFSPQNQGGTAPYPQTQGSFTPYPQRGFSPQNPGNAASYPQQGFGFSLTPQAGGPQPYPQQASGYSGQAQSGRQSSPYPQPGSGYLGQSVPPQNSPSPHPQQGVGCTGQTSQRQPPQLYQGAGFSQQNLNSFGGASPHNLNTMSAPYPSSGQQPGQSGQPQGPGYPTGQPPYPTGSGPTGQSQGPGNPTGQPPYPTGSGPTGQPPYPTGSGPTGQSQGPGYPTGQPPYPTGSGPTGQPPYPTGSGPTGQSQGPGYPTGQPPYPTGSGPTGQSQGPGNPTGQPPYRTGSGPTGQSQGPGYPTGQPPYPQSSGPTGQPNQPPYPQNSGPGYPTGSSQPQGAPPGYPQGGPPPSRPPPPRPQSQPGYPQGAPPPPGGPPSRPVSQPAYQQQGPGGGYAAQQPPAGYPAPQGNPQGMRSPNPAQGRPGQEQFCSKVELRLECKNLLNKDIMSKSDPCAVLYTLSQSGRWEELGRTENVVNCLDPRFSRSFVINYFFEEVQKLMIAVYDLDNNTPQLTDDDFLGQIETTLGQVVSSTPYIKPLLLRSGRKAGNGVITVRAEEIKEGTEKVAMTFHAKKLDKKDFLGKSDPYLEVLRATPDGSWQVVHRTEVVKNNLSPSWRPFELPMHSLCGTNRSQSIKFDVYDWDSDGSHDYIGGFSTTLDEMLKASQQEVSWPCVNPKKKAKKKGYTNSGVVLLSSCKLVKNYTFLDYIFGGMQINFTLGIDFTGSNGHPSKPTSLHYINPYQPNEYMQAIRAVGDVCQDYDTDKMFPALGFGAKIPPNMEVLHEFAINFNPSNPYCAGIDGVLQAYYNCIQQVQLYGPTNASPIINHVAKFAAAAQQEEPQKGAHSYFILLMLTDGVLSDMSSTKQAIVTASRLPMSLIIVGIGSADFSDMDELDGDNGVLRAPSGEPCKRDIVQFVPFRDFKRSSSAELARFVLAEVPKQVTDYYKMRGMQPNKAHTTT